MYVWNARKLAVRREQIRSGDRAVKLPAHAHSCDGFKPTDKLTLQVVVDIKTQKKSRAFKLPAWGTVSTLFGNATCGLPPV